MSINLPFGAIVIIALARAAKIDRNGILRRWVCIGCVMCTESNANLGIEPDDRCEQTGTRRVWRKVSTRKRVRGARNVPRDTERGHNLECVSNAKS